MEAVAAARSSSLYQEHNIFRRIIADEVLRSTLPGAARKQKQDASKAPRGPSSRGAAKPPHAQPPAPGTASPSTPLPFPPGPSLAGATPGCPRCAVEFPLPAET